jgi:hypothetical protein
MVESIKLLRIIVAETKGAGEITGIPTGIQFNPKYAKHILKIVKN